MKTEELMIGDWVLWDNTLPCIVTTIGCDYIETTKCGITLAESHLLQGVPLTREILEKNGFNLSSDKSELGTLDTYWLGSELGAFRIHRLNNGDYQFGLAKIKYVHQLQHALKLCGIYKEIEV